MTLLGRLKRGRESYLDRHFEAGAFRVRLFSASTYSLWRVCAPLMSQHCKGLTLDAGSGRGAWRTAITATGSDYESIDIAPRGGDRPTWTGDVSGMPQVPTGRYQTVVSHQVLEHVRHPVRCVAEFHRVLSPGGNLIISVPHLSRRHELPHDYQRYTQEGLTALLQDAGFVDIQCFHYGGLMCLVHHQTSFFFPGMLLGVPVIGAMAFLANAPFSWVWAWLDHLVDRRGLMPLGVVAVARKAPAGIG